jgi:hypothetical protein
MPCGGCCGILTPLNSFFSIAFASFVEAHHDFSQSFSSWLKVHLFSWSPSRVAYRLWIRRGQRFTSKPQTAHSCVTHLHEKISQVLFLRRSYGARLSIFSPVNDLSSLSKSGPRWSLMRSQTNDIAISGGQVLGDEYSDHVLKVRDFTDKCVARS